MSKQNFNTLANLGRAFTARVEISEVDHVVSIGMKAWNRNEAFLNSIAMIRELSRQSLITGFTDVNQILDLRGLQFNIADEVHMRSSRLSPEIVNVDLERGLAHRIQNRVSFDFDPDMHRQP